MIEYERGDCFEEDLSYHSDDDSMSDFIREHRIVYEIRRVVEDKDTGETLYYMQSTEGFETQLSDTVCCEPLPIRPPDGRLSIRQTVTANSIRVELVRISTRWPTT